MYLHSIYIGLTAFSLTKNNSEAMQDVTVSVENGEYNERGGSSSNNIVRRLLGPLSLCRHTTKNR